MVNAEETEDEAVSRQLKWTPKVIIGGKGPPEPPADNWLGEFEVGTTFVARHRNSKEVDFNLYYVLFKLPEVVLLKWILPDGKLLDYHVDPVRFSKMFEKAIVLSVIKPQEAAVADEEHERNRTDRPSDVVLDETVS